MAGFLRLSIFSFIYSVLILTRTARALNTPRSLHKNSIYKIRLVQTVIRQAHRTPLYKLPFDDKKSWPHPQLGQLTAEGKRELIELGRQSRARYVISKQETVGAIVTNFLPETFNGAASNPVYARSTDIDRALESAEMFLKGMYPDEVIPVHAVPTEEDNLLLAERLCSKIDTQRQRVQQKIATLGNFSDLFRKLEKGTGIEHISISNFRTVGDSIMTLAGMNPLQTKHVPRPLRDMSRNVLKETQTLLDKYNYYMYSDEDFGRLSGGNLLRDMLDRITVNIDNAKGSNGDLPPSFVLFAAHASTISSLLSALRKPVRHVPEFASQLRIELLERVIVDRRGTNEFFLRFIYNGKPLTLNGCALAVCPLQTVINFLDDMIPPSIASWNIECGNKLPKLRAMKVQEYLGIEWEEWPNMAIFLGLIFIFETVAFDAVVCNKIRKRLKKSSRSKNNNVFLSELEEAAKSNAGNTNIGGVKGGRQQRKRSCYIFCGGCVGIFTAFVMLLAFGIEWDEWPVVSFVLCTLIAVESSAIAAVFVHAKYFEKSTQDPRGQYLPLRTDNEADIYDFDEANPTDIRNIRNTNLNESDFGDVSEIL